CGHRRLDNLGSFRFRNPHSRSEQTSILPSLPFTSFIKEPQSGHLEPVKLCTLYFLSLFLISNTSCFVCLRIFCRNAFAFPFPRAIASKSASHFAVSLGDFNSSFTSSINCFPFGVGCNRLLLRSITSELSSFSIISARVAGVPSPYFSICASKSASV